MLTYATRPVGDVPRVEVTRNFTTLPSTQLHGGDLAHHTTTVQGRPTLFSISPSPQFQSVTWQPTSGIALTVTGYELTERDILQVANDLGYERGITFHYPNDPLVRVSGEQARGVVNQPTRDLAAKLTSLGELDVLAHPGHPINHQPTIVSGMRVTTPVWAVWNTHATAAAHVSVIDAATKRILATTTVDTRTLDSLTDRSQPGCHPPYGVLTRSEITHLNKSFVPTPFSIAAQHRSEHAELTTLSVFSRTRVGKQRAQCELHTCEPSAPVWLFINSAPTNSLLPQRGWGPTQPSPTPKLVTRRLRRPHRHSTLRNQHERILRRPRTDPHRPSRHH